jgi:hypothetical protein
MKRRVLGVILGSVAAFAAVFAVEGISLLVYPLPKELKPDDMNALRQYIQTLPLGAFLFVLAAHAIGPMLGAFVCALIVKERWITGSLIIGITFLIWGIINLFSIPHPVWFAVIDVLAYIPFALLGGWLGWRAAGRTGKTPSSALLA